MNYFKIHLKEHYAFLGTDGRDAVLTAYLPYNLAEMHRQNDKRPCIFICPGGAYSFCCERESEPVALNFLNDGYNVFVLNYSTAPHTFPSQLLEIAASLDLICKNADAWNSDIQKTAIFGFSAGGHLACHYSNCFDCDEVRAYFPQSIGVKAAVLCYPVISANPEFAHMDSFKNLLGTDALTAEQTEKFSLENCVTAKTPPTYIWHTAADTFVPPLNSLAYAQALAKRHIPFELHIFPFGYHGLSTADKQTCDNLPEEMRLCNDWIAEVKKWLKLILK